MNPLTLNPSLGIFVHHKFSPSDIMTQREKELKQMVAFTKSIKGDREKARALLIGAGIITEKGNLRKPYKNLRFPIAKT